MCRLGVTPVGDHPGAKRSGGGAWPAAHQAAVKDQGDLIGSADVEVVADDLLEEHPPRHRLVEHLGQGELDLQDRQVVAVSRVAIGGGEWMRQSGQPFA
jgi:hypothetical protein